MKRVLTALLLCVVGFAVLPIHASAWGGYIAIRGESVYHDPYCEELIGAEYSKLRWFDTKKQAESAGLSPCDVCDSDERDDFSELEESYFVTNDKKLDALFDAVLEYGSCYGYENGYTEGYSEASHGIEDMDGYEIGYSEGYSKGCQDRKEGYSSVDYSDGFNDGYDKMKVEAEAQISELQSAHEEELRRAKSEIPWTAIIITALISFLGCKYFCSLKYEPEIQKLQKEASEVQSDLNRNEKTLSILNLIAKRSGMTMDQLATTLYINFRKMNGATEEEAKTEIYNNQLKGS